MLVPSLEVTLLDSLNKRLDWLQKTCGVLSLQNVRTLHAAANTMAGHLLGFPVVRQDTSARTPRPMRPGTVSRGPRLPRPVAVKKK